MKFLATLAHVYLGSAVLGVAATIAFDDISAGNDGSMNYPPLTNGYADLQWNNFRVLDGLDSSPSGYKTGVVSANNVAFNSGGNPAFFSSSTPFDLYSGYFTAAWNDGLNLEIKGYVGTKLTYDNTYVLSSTAPELLELNYLGVDELSFSASGGNQHEGYLGQGTEFVMDNLSLDPATGVPDAGVTSFLLGISIFCLGIVKMKITARQD